MNEYIECTECGFVLLSASSSDPVPRRVDSCPDCGSTDFRFSRETSSDLGAADSEDDE